MELAKPIPVKPEEPQKPIAPVIPIEPDKPVTPTMPKTGQADSLWVEVALESEEPIQDSGEPKILDKYADLYERNPDIVRYLSNGEFLDFPTMQIDTLFEEQTYEVLGVFLQQVFPEDYDGFKYYDYVGDISEEEFNEYKWGISKLMRSGDVSSLEYGDKIIELSICYYHVKNGRLVIVCRRQS